MPRGLPARIEEPVQKIFVGDVQGCGDELEELLARAQGTFGTDFELWCVGDLINRGPKNLLALRLVRELMAVGRGHYVLGNHEIGLLRIWLGLRKFEPKHTHSEVLEADAKQGWMDWIRSQCLSVGGEVEGSKFAMVHAAVHPHWSLEELAAKARIVDRQRADLGRKSRGRPRHPRASDPVSQCGREARLVKRPARSACTTLARGLVRRAARLWRGLWALVPARSSRCPGSARSGHRMCPPRSKSRRLPDRVASRPRRLRIQRCRSVWIARRPLLADCGAPSLLRLRSCLRGSPIHHQSLPSLSRFYVHAAVNFGRA